MSLCRCLLTLYLLLMATLAVGQQGEEVQLLSARDDTAKVIRLADYAYSFVDKDKEKARRLYGELMRISKKLNYPYWMGMTWFNLGYMHAKEAKDKEAIQDYKKALLYLQNTDRIDQIASCYLNIGFISERVGDVNQNIHYLLEAARLLENTKHKELLNYAYSGMGVAFYNLDDYPKGLFYFKKSVALAREIRDTALLIEGLYGISNCLSSSRDFEAAQRHAQETLDLATAFGNDYSLGVAHTSLAELYVKWGKAQPAIQHAQRVLGYANAADDMHYRLIGLMNLGEGYGLVKDHRRRIQYLSEALRIGAEQGIVIQLDDIYKGLSEAYSGIGEYKKGLDYYQKYIFYRDSATNEKNKRNVAELEIKYQTAQREKTLSQKQLQIARQEALLQKSSRFTVISISTTLVALLVAGMVYTHYKHKRKQHQRQLQSLQKDKEIQLLQALMQGEEKERSRIAKDLHDGVAGMLAAAKMHLSSLGTDGGGVAKAEGYRKASRLLDEAAQEVRKTSHNLMPEVLTQYGLDEALRRYCSGINNSKSIAVQYDSWGEIGRFMESFELSVYRIVQELLNNIVKHSSASEALVQVSQQDGLLCLTIEDNGVGFQDKGKKDGMGLQSLLSRVKAMNGRMELETESGSGVSAYLEFDVTGLQKEVVYEPS